MGSNPTSDPSFPTSTILSNTSLKSLLNNKNVYLLSSVLRIGSCSNILLSNLCRLHISNFHSRYFDPGWMCWQLLVCCSIPPLVSQPGYADFKNYFFCQMVTCVSPFPLSCSGMYSIWIYIILVLIGHKIWCFCPFWPVRMLCVINTTYTEFRKSFSQFLICGTSTIIWSPGHHKQYKHTRKKVPQIRNWLKLLRSFLLSMS